MSADVLDLQLPITETDRVAGTNAEANSRNDALSPVICYRNPADVRTIRRQSWLLVLAFIL
jgi:hypothetical protein